MSVSHTPATHAHPELGFLRKYIFSEDHKVIGIQFLFSGLIFLFVGGALALLVRIQLGWPASTAPHICEVVSRELGRTACRRTSTPCSSACTPR